MCGGGIVMGKGFTPNKNGSELLLLSKRIGKSSRGRNRILLGAVILCIVTLTVVFGISYGKIQAEAAKAVRTAGTAASASIERGDQSQYELVRSLSYVETVGRSVSVGTAGTDESMESVRIMWLDETAYEELMKPAYTDIKGHYPKEKNELMLSDQALKNLGIDSPKIGMKLRLDVNIGLFETKSEEFRLCGWFTSYAENADLSELGYISGEMLRQWGFRIEEESDILLCQSGSLDWQETEERLYRDAGVKNSGQKISVSNTYVFDAVNQLAGGYGMAVFGGIVILSGMFFLICNVMQISMAGDIRQMGLLNIIGTTKKQIRKIYYAQMLRVLIPGAAAGAVLSAAVLCILLPDLLGRQYLNGYGGGKGLEIFRPEILAAAILFTGVLMMGAAVGVIRRVSEESCAENTHYTGLEKNNRKKRNSFKNKSRKIKAGRRSAGAEIWYMAGQNLLRYRGRFLLTVFSLFLGAEALLCVSVIISGSDYEYVIRKRPDFLIAGQFSDWGQEQGYGNEYKTRDAGEDPFETQGDTFELLYANSYDEFSPVSAEVREKLLKLDGVEQEKSYIMEGAYMISTISKKGIRPLADGEEIAGEEDEWEADEWEEDGKYESGEYAEDAGDRAGVGYYYDSGYQMIENTFGDVIQILKDEEISELKRYISENHLAVDMESLENGTGVMVLHDHMLTPAQEEMAKESVGEPLYFTCFRTREEIAGWDQRSEQEQDEYWNDHSGAVRKRSDEFMLCGYLDNRAEGIPQIRQNWQGGEGMIYYLISEKGFEKLPTEKKTLFMELNVEAEKESAIKVSVEEIISDENRQRDQMNAVKAEGETGEAGIFCISKSDLLAESAEYIRGSRIILGSISAVLLFAGLMNYFNVMVTGILSRKKELEVMESIGMTKKQKKRLFLAEGMYYCLITAALILTAGSAILQVVRLYMERKLSYFVFVYPAEWLLLLLGGLLAVCLGIKSLVLRINDRESSRPE